MIICYKYHFMFNDEKGVPKIESLLKRIRDRKSSDPMKDLKEILKLMKKVNDAFPRNCLTLKISKNMQKFNLSTLKSKKVVWE